MSDLLATAAITNSLIVIALVYGFYQRDGFFGMGKTYAIYHDGRELHVAKEFLVCLLSTKIDELLWRDRSGVF